MPEKKLLSRLGSLLDLGARRRKKKADELEQIIKKLKKAEKSMITSCRDVSKGKERDTLAKRYRILHAQRKKGQKALKKINRG